MTDRKDLVIIGSGPAGLSAAVYAQRAMLDQVVIEKEPFSGGQIITTERIDNYRRWRSETDYTCERRNDRNKSGSFCDRGTS